MAKAKNNHASFSDRLDKLRTRVSSIRERDNNGKAVAADERNATLIALDELLTEVQASELPQANAIGKRIRSLNRSLGYYISKRGRASVVLAKAKPERKAKRKANANANATDVTTPVVATEANANA